jgi:hypothetical protein
VTVMAVLLVFSSPSFGHTRALPKTCIVVYPLWGNFMPAQNENRKATATSKKQMEKPPATVTRSGMHVTALPDYTTERYSVLADLEQRADFHGANELNDGPDQSMQAAVYGIDPSCKLPSKKVEDFSCIYLLWDVRNLSKLGLTDELTSKIDKVLSAASLTATKCQRIYLSVEVIISRCEDRNWDKCPAKDIVEKTFATIKELYNFGFVGLAVADDVSGSHAIAAILTYLEHIGGNIPQIAGLMNYGTTVKVGHVYTVDRAELLGFAKNRDPDAASGVFQVLIASLAPPEMLVLEHTLVESSKRDFAEVSDSSNIPFLYSPTFTLSLAVALLAGLYYLYFVDGLLRK